MGAILSYFTFLDFWYRNICWPILLSGVLLILSMNRSRHPLLGFYVAMFSCWAVAFVYSRASDMNVFDRFDSIVASLYSVPDIHPETGIWWNNAIEATLQPPPFPFYHMSLVFASIGLTLVPYFSQHNRWRSFLKLPVYFWNVLIVLAFQQQGFVLMTFTHFLIGGLMEYQRIKSSMRECGKKGAMLLILILGMMGILNPAITKIQQYLFAGSPVLYATSPVSFVGYLNENSLFFNPDFFSSDYIVLTVLTIGLILMLIERLRHRDERDPLFPVALSLLIFSVLSIYPNGRTIVFLPTFWFAFGLIQNTIKDKGGVESGWGEHYQPFDIKALSIGAGLLVLLSCWTLLSEWRTDHILSSLSKKEDGDPRTQLIHSAFQTTPYRADIAAIYVTDRALSFYRQRQIPSEQNKIELDYCFNLSSRYGFIPTYAYKLLADVYFHEAKFEESIQVYREAIERHPNHLLLLGMMAVVLDTLGQRDDAIKTYKLCANLDPTLAEIRRRLARLYQLEGQDALAKSEYLHSFLLNPIQPLPVNR